MSRLNSITLAAVALAAPRGGLADPQDAAPSAMSIESILEAVIDANQNLAAKQFAADALAAERRSTAGNFGPVLRAEVSGMLWDSDNIFQFDTSGFHALFEQMGAPRGTQVPPIGVTVREDITFKTSLMTELQDRAAAERPELLSAREQLAAARAGADAELGKMLPELNLVAAYNHNEGMGDFMLKDEFFGGLMLEWNFWDWGVSYNKLQAASLRAKQAAAQVRAAEDGLRLEVHQRLLELEEARKQRDVADAALRLAEENLRLERNKYAVQQTTAADLLSAQTAELKARNDRTVAIMQMEMARRALQIASGRDLLDSEGSKLAQSHESAIEEQEEDQ
jgi:hypothetical protein